MTEFDEHTQYSIRYEGYSFAVETRGEIRGARIEHNIAAVEVLEGRGTTSWVVGIMILP
jgi:hypothetical protein